jgi:hypothetical protein
MAPMVEDELTASDAAVHVVCGSWDKEVGFAPWDSSQARTGHHDSPQQTSEGEIE